MNRSADSTIKGYYYQFDTAILKLLQLDNDSDSITVEGIEDVDINTNNESTFVQCKYLSKPKFINSAVRKPIMLMLDHFRSSSLRGDLNYVLYAHFTNNAPGTEPQIDLDRLKSILTYKVEGDTHEYHTDNSIGDDVLNEFLSKFKFSFGLEFSQQQELIIRLIKDKYSCSNFDAEMHYYNNALKIIIDKSVQSNIANRVIVKSDFLVDIDCSERLFNEWFIKLKTKKAYFKEIVKALKLSRAYDPERSKVFIISSGIMESNNSELNEVTFIENIINKYYKLGKALRNAKPITLVIDIGEHEINELKRRLIAEKVIFNDGLEHILFSSYVFNKNPVITKTRNAQKIQNSSYNIRLISKSTFMTNIEVIDSPRVLINFDVDQFLPNMGNCQIHEIKHCENLKEVNSILNK